MASDDIGGSLVDGLSGVIDDATVVGGTGVGAGGDFDGGAGGGMGGSVAARAVTWAAAASSVARASEQAGEMDSGAGDGIDGSVVGGLHPYGCRRRWRHKRRHWCWSRR